MCVSPRQVTAVRSAWFTGWRGPHREGVVVAELPSGTVTFLFTDLEGSTRLWQEHPDAMRPALARHDELLRDAIAVHRGQIVKTTGDGAHAVFADASDAIDASVAAQLALVAEAWSLPEPLRVRMGLHSGPAELRDGDYYGTAVNRAARIMSVAHGGQIVVSAATGELVRDTPVELVDLGEHRLRDLGQPERIFQVVGSQLAREFPPIRSLDAFSTNLTAQRTSFVGRNAELLAVRDALAEARLVTLTGVGGVGKTRLGVQAAAELLPSFRDGVWLVELAPVRDPDQVASTVAGALDVAGAPGRSLTEQLVDVLSRKRVLVVLDNCEHLLDGVAELVDALMDGCPQVVVLATSREGLGVAGERILAVRSLAVPRDDTDVEEVANVAAVRLFVDRAAAVAMSFSLTARNAAAVVEVCRRLDGIPLAIELAAARVPVLSPAQIAQRLDHRFRLLAGAERGAVDRHATLRAAIDWSFDLLTDAEQRILARLSIFAGGCTLDAAEQVCSDDLIAEFDVLDLLSALVARSLAAVDDTDPNEHRYRLLETIRQYAEERLDPTEHEQVRDRHARYYAGFREAALAGVRGSEPGEWLERLDLELGNVKTAMAEAIAAGDIPVLLQFLASNQQPLPFYLAGRGVDRFAEDVVELLSRSEDQSPSAFVAFLAAARAAQWRGEWDRAEQLLDQLRAAAPGRSLPVEMHDAEIRHHIARNRGDIPMAMKHAQRAIDAAAHCDPWTHAWMLTSQGGHRLLVGDLETAALDVEAGLAAARQLGNPILTAFALVMLADAVAYADPERGRALLLEGVSFQRSLGARYLDDATLLITAWAAAIVREDEIALRAAAEFVDRGNANTIFNFAPVLEVVASSIAGTAPEDAAVLHGIVDTIAPERPYSALRPRTNAEIDTAVDPTLATELHAQGTQMSVNDVAVYVSGLIARQLAEH
jgi:predicted ATPase/class 3 adenylate cyclase